MAKLYALKTVNDDMSLTFTRQLTREMEILRRTGSFYIVRCHRIFTETNRWRGFNPHGVYGQRKPIADEVSILCNSFVGTCAYMSPERFDSVAEENSDVYACDISSFVEHFLLLPRGQRHDWVTES
ncbi:PREDICTED: mitogen-activated protein kinase kinase 7-like [Camelina sativa]|uniref:Mitogen-activated protein kinase kinase 7-like n=1 Tax=Camelina sativa TaxID=90675 RepID=A0ABM0VIP8_CAMSA|nr:PREDICTED: mitogen-activated protein kinase kinase 7-like [Camelina sativa]